MGRRNYLVEGVSGTGKTSVCDELQRRGYHAVHGDRELAYQGDPATGAAVAGHAHEHHLWRVEQVRALVADQARAATFFCGGSRNHSQFIGLFDAVFVLTVDLDTLRRRLDRRPADEWGGRPSERELVERLHRSGEDTPDGIVIDATAPVERVVDQMLDVAGPGPARHRDPDDDAADPPPPPTSPDVACAGRGHEPVAPSASPSRPHTAPTAPTAEEHPCRRPPPPSPPPTSPRPGP